MPGPLYLGIDFGTSCVRAVIVDKKGRLAAAALGGYLHGQIVPGPSAADRLFPAPLPPGFALQHPRDWIDGAAHACRLALRRARAEPSAIAGIGVDFTSCTMLPCRADGTPLCFKSLFNTVRGRRDTAVKGPLFTDPHAWPKLWKHHGAVAQTERLNTFARRRREPWLPRYGGVIGLEWFFPKILEVIENSPQVAAQADVWLEAGDWLVWQLIGAPSAGGSIDAADLPRSTCQAGYKAMWSAKDGYPSAVFLRALHPELARVRADKLPGRFLAPGESAGTLCDSMAKRLGLSPGTPVSAAIIDAHAGVPGAGVGEPGALVMVLGTSGCHMLLAKRERRIPGVAGVVKDGILPGFYGYETGQASMGDGFALARRLAGEDDFSRLDGLAAETPPGAEGTLALDWFNGCRTPLMDGALTGAFLGVTLETRPHHLYRAALEASALGLRWIVDTLREGGVPVRRFIATGGLPNHNPLFLSIVASALGESVEIHGAPHGPALGAAILGALTAGPHRGFADPHDAVESMAGCSSRVPPSRTIRPNRAAARAYDRLYPVYRALAADMARPDSPMRRLAALR